MKTITLTRVSSSNEGTFGVLLDDDILPFAVTAELPWKQNQPRISCIPAGEYLCKKIKSPKFGNTFEVTNVTGRSHILFHTGNIPLEDSLGCILVAEMFETLEGKLAITESRNGFGEFMFRVRKEKEFTLKIKKC